MGATYNFRNFADDGVRLRIGGTDVIVDNSYHAEQQRLGSIFLTSGGHALELVFFEGGGEFTYYKDKEKTDDSRNDKGWSTLGDVGYVDEEGFLYLTDRKSYMIISGGVNIYPQEAENILVTHPRVMDVAVFGVPNDDFGEEVKAVVQPKDMSDAGPELEEELIEFARSHLSHIKCPRSIDFEEELPRHPTGKLYKRLLKDRYWKDHKGNLAS